MNMRGLANWGLLLGATTYLAACGGGAGQTKVDSGTQDAAPLDQAADAAENLDIAMPLPDGDVSDAGGGDGGIECAPVPTGGPTPAGTAPPQAAGPVVTSTATRPELTQAVADEQFTAKKVLARGGLIFEPSGALATSDGGVVNSAEVTYSVNDDWDPLANGIGDPATFKPMFIVAADGSGTHRTVNAATTEAIFLAGCTRVYIRLMPGTYREQVLVASKTSAPPITIYSAEADASKTTIVFNASAATVGNMSSSATMTIKALSGFQMKNVTVSNDYVEGSSPGNDQSAVAFLNQADRSQFENVRILGNIAPLYLKSVDVNLAARSYFRDSYVEGDQDIILGRGTAVFDHTEIKYLTARQPTGGIIASPATLVYNRYGFLFESCKFTAEAGASGVFLAHQWMESANPLAVGKMIVRNSTLGGHIAVAAPWSTLGARMTTPKDPAGATPLVVYNSDQYFPVAIAPAPAEAFIGEYGNSGPGAHP